MKAVFLPQAQRELTQAIDFYEEQLKNLGTLFSKEVLESIHLICLYPEAYPSLTSYTRKCSLRKFPYMILYGIIDNTIVISAIAHQHRHPDAYLHN